MDDNKAHTIVATLANGVDPLTGREFPADSPYQSPDVVRALFAAAQALDVKLRSRKAEPPANAGKPWSEEEDRRLLTQLDAGQNVQELARLHARTVAGIQARLERHGRLQPQETPQERPRPQPSSARRRQASAGRRRGSGQ